jgi:putative MATE family efflux protein
MQQVRTFISRVSSPGYSRRDVYRSILTLAWPAIVEQLLIMMVGVVSTIFVGRIGTPDLAAVGLVNMIIIFIQTVFAGLATGATVIIARQTGAGDIAGAKVALAQSLLLGLAAGICVSLPAFIFARPILSLFFGATNPAVLEIGLRYYRLVMIGMPFFVLDIIVAGAVRGTGDTKTPMLVTLAANIVNLGLSSLLIFGVRSGDSLLIPAFGIVGAGISVMVTRIFAGTMRILLVFLKKSGFQLSLRDRFAPDPAMIARIFRVGLPAFVEQLVMQGGFLVMQVLIISLGIVQSASFQVGINVNSLAFMPIFGLAIASTTLVGQTLGKGDHRLAGVLAFEANLLAVALISVLGCLIFAFSHSLADIYSADPAVVETSASVIRLFALVCPFLGMMNVSAGVLRAAGDIVYVTVTALVGLWVFRIGLAWVLTHFFNFDIYGVMTGVVIDFVVRSSMYGLRVRAGRWRYLEV